jgi:coatomer protein complex subunit gamma
MCISELENLITDPNRSVASLAISTLLKTCKEEQVEKLLKQISSYLPDLGIEFKIETIQSTAQLYHRLPNKAGQLLKFLADCLKDDSNVLFRESVVDTIIQICPAQRENALMILAEHIEDCEHAHIQTKILNFLASEGPLAKNPSSYIRFIYNRVNLEKSVIRAAAVSSLAAFAHKVPSLRQSIILLLKKCLTDSDDEVRERAHFYIRIFEIQEGNDAEATAQDKSQAEDLRHFLFDEEMTIDVSALESYISENRDRLAAEDEFEIDISSMIQAAQREVSIIKKAEAVTDSKHPAAAQSQQSTTKTVTKAESVPACEDAFDVALKQVGAFSTFLQQSKH